MGNSAKLYRSRSDRFAAERAKNGIASGYGCGSGGVRASVLLNWEVDWAASLTFPRLWLQHGLLG
jgi:hypothetical protein